MPLATNASRPSKESTSEVDVKWAGWTFGFEVVRHRPEEIVEAAIALLGLAAVALDPLG